jgi:hypothetical protein
MYRKGEKGEGRVVGIGGVSLFFLDFAQYVVEIASTDRRIEGGVMRIGG